MILIGDIFREIKGMVSMPDILNVYNIKIERSGFVLCPFHSEKSPSAKIYKNNLHCFGCGANVDIIDFVSEYDNISKKEALLKIDGLFSLNLVSNNNLSDFDRLTYTIRRKERELDKYYYYTLIDKSYNNLVCKLESELKNLKQKLFSAYDEEINDFFRNKAGDVKKCNTKS